MYKKLSEWQQERREAYNKIDPRNQNGVDPTVWNSSKRDSPHKSDNNAADEVGKIHLELKEINQTLRTASKRWNGLQAGPTLTSREFHRLLRRRETLISLLPDLELRCAAAKYERRIDFERHAILEAQAAKITLATVFMNMAREMLAGDVYQRVLIAAVHRYEGEK